MGPALKALLPKLGLSSTLARDLVHAVPRHGGPDITHVYTAADNMITKMFIGHLWVVANRNWTLDPAYWKKTFENMDGYSNHVELKNFGGSWIISMVL